MPSSMCRKFQNVSDFSPALSIHKIPLFNPLSGYGDYIFPSGCTLNYSSDDFIGSVHARASLSTKRTWRPSYTQLAGIFLCILTIGTLGCFYLFGFTFWLMTIHGVKYLGHVHCCAYLPQLYYCDDALSSPPFLTCQNVQDMSSFFSSLRYFSLGTAWPHAAMPEWMRNLC